MFRWSHTLLVLPLVMFAARVAAEPGKAQPFDWPQWQGAKRLAMSDETGLLKKWPAGGPTQVWKITGIGASYSTPSIAAGRIFLMGNKANNNADKDKKTEFVYALDETDGKQLWAYPIGPERSGGGGYPGPRSTPTIDGNRLYTLGLNGDLVCLEVASGQLVWRKDLRKDYNGVPGGWGYTESPLIDGDKILITPGGKKSTIVALDKITGKTLWTSVVPQGDRAGYSSIAIADVPGQKQYTQFLGNGVVGIDAATGKYLWRYNAPANGTANISTPIYHAGHVFAASAYSTGGGLVKLEKEGTDWNAKQVYFTKNMQNHHGGMILLDGHLYGNNGPQLACIEFLTGTVKWQSKLPGKGSITYADGCFYYRNEKGNGTIHLIEVNPEKYIPLDQFDQPERSRSSAWAHPVIANGKLYIADQDVLLCYDVKKK